MPLNTTNFLVSQGWEGVGVPLDGKTGKGLKKPLAITQKRTLSGIGRDRDRADDWWNSIFTAGAKSLSIGPSPASSGASTPTLDKSTASSSGTSWTMGERSAASTTMSLSSLAKREHARKTLMSNFVRGKPIVPAVEPTIITPKPSAAAAVNIKADEVVAASDAEVDAVLSIASSSSSKLGPPSNTNPTSKRSGKGAEKLERKLAKKALRNQLGGPVALVAAPLGNSSKRAATDNESKKSKSRNGDKKSKKPVTTKSDDKASTKGNAAIVEESTSTAIHSGVSSLKKRKRDRTVESADHPSVSSEREQKKEQTKKQRVDAEIEDVKLGKEKKDKKKGKKDTKGKKQKSEKRETKDKKERKEKKDKEEKKSDKA